jgi:hypothetical protein
MSVHCQSKFVLSLLAPLAVASSIAIADTLSQSAMITNGASIQAALNSHPRTSCLCAAVLIASAFNVQVANNILQPGSAGVSNVPLENGSLAKNSH